MDYILGIDLGGTQIKVLALDPVSGASLGEWITQTRDGEREGNLPAFAWEIQRLVGDIEAKLAAKPQAIGLASPGLADRAAEKIAFMRGRMAGLEGLDWPSFFAMPGQVRVLNDGHAALIGEVWQGAAKNLRDVILLTLGTGVGGAILSGGRLLRGHIGRAGHLGHVTVDLRGAPDICGTPGSLEDFVGNCTVEKRSRGRFRNTLHMAEAARAGDEEAARVWADSTRALAVGIASLVNALDPEAVILGGGIATLGQPLFHDLAKQLDAVEWRPNGQAVRLLPAQLGEYAGAYGAAWYAMNPQLYGDP